LVADRGGLQRIDQSLKEIGVESDIYQIDIDRNMSAPSYVSMLLVPFSHYLDEHVLGEIVVQLSWHERRVRQITPA
jgi:hypothetical protein